MAALPASMSWARRACRPWSAAGAGRCLPDTTGRDPHCPVRCGFVLEPRCLPEGRVAIAWGKATVDSRTTADASLFRSCPEIVLGLREHKCRGGGPSIVHLFGYPTHIRVNLGALTTMQAARTRSGHQVAGLTDRVQLAGGACQDAAQIADGRSAIQHMGGIHEGTSMGRAIAGLSVLATASVGLLATGVAGAAEHSSTQFDNLKPIKPPSPCKNDTGVDDSTIKVGTIVPTSGPFAPSTRRRSTASRRVSRRPTPR